MKKLKAIRATMCLLVSLPIWFYLIYSILVAIDASELTWFLFWVYLPASALVSFISNLIDE
jgi:hypothetical protein